MDPNDDPLAGDEEAAMRYAIALSLQDHSAHAPISTSHKPIVIDSDDEDGDLDHVWKCPPTPKKPNPQTPSAATGQRPLHQHQTMSQAVKPTGLAALGLDRKKMEEERLARGAAKRKAPHGEQTPDPRPQQRTKAGVQFDSTPLLQKAHVDKKLQPPALPYPKGIVRKTWAMGYPRQNDIKIEEILQKEQLELAVLSSFQWDDDWLLSKVDTGKTKMVCIAFASSDAQKEEMRANVPADRIRFCFPPMVPAGSMHSKLQLLKFPKYMRIVVPTGNLVPYDWGETGVMENMVFLIDLPMATQPKKQVTMFEQELCYFLKASGLDESLIDSLSKYDFSETEQYRFVHTIGQSHVGTAWKRTGYCGLGRAVKSLGLATTSNVQLDFVTASLGAVNTDLLSAIYNATQGDNGMREYTKRTANGGKKKAAQKAEPSYKPDDFRIYFPSHETVNRSRGGSNNGGTICLQSKWWDSTTFPRELVHDCKSVRPGLLMHTKALYARHTPHNSISQVSWAYIGSANLSESAWGRLVRDKASGQPKLNCRNWECGVLILGESNKPGWAAFEERLHVPMIVPGEAYGKTNSRRPWLFLEP
ncbi:tyrosyl-DNA phosphodiesterase-domain-containing protein [Astrocystis sublimbata]|nr:tyrosyl-DNA phosphodiesterase-domain-containing protein [Astrocystis sublimbata]